jgi:hypothetical protein
MSISSLVARSGSLIGGGGIKRVGGGTKKKVLALQNELFELSRGFYGAGPGDPGERLERLEDEKGEIRRKLKQLRGQ